jgi:glucose/arabinose dehydrogenase
MTRWVGLLAVAASLTAIAPWASGAMAQVAAAQVAGAQVAAAQVAGAQGAAAQQGAPGQGAVQQAARTGAAAYGDWRTDAPGVVRHITPGDLPAPGASPSSSDAPGVVNRPSGALPQVPAGFTVRLWASGLVVPRTLRTAPNGDVFLAETGGGRVLVWRAAESGAQPAPPTVFARRLDGPFGIAFWPPANPRFVYVAETNRVLRYPYDGGTQPTGPAQVIIASLPEGGHSTRDLAVAPDGSRLFVSVGSASNVARGMRGTPVAANSAASGAGAGDEAGRAAVFSFAPDGKGGLSLVASGIRNCVGLAVQPPVPAGAAPAGGAAQSGGTLWCVTNERDGMGDDLPPDYATRVRAGDFFGWPWYYIGVHEDPRHAGERPDLAGRISVPDVLIQPHSAPLGIAFYDGTLFPAPYRGDAFVTLHGSWNRSKRTGYKVVRLLMHDGVPTGAYEDFLTGFVADQSSVWGRPVGVTVAHDGALLVSEDANGTIWRVAH